MNADEDRDLAARFLDRRDEAAFRSLYRRHTPAVYQLVLRLSGLAASDAEEIVQEAWVRAATGLAAFRWESGLRTWLSAIAINCWREHARARRRETDLADRDVPVLDPRPGRVARLDLERAIAALADGYRAVLVLHDIEGRTHEEIAGLLGIDPGTSKSQLSRARRAVRRWLSNGATGTEGERP